MTHDPKTHPVGPGVERLRREIFKTAETRATWINVPASAQQDIVAALETIESLPSHFEVRLSYIDRLGHRPSEHTFLSRWLAQPGVVITARTDDIVSVAHHFLTVTASGVWHRIEKSGASSNTWYAVSENSPLGLILSEALLSITGVEPKDSSQASSPSDDIVIIAQRVDSERTALFVAAAQEAVAASTQMNAHARPVLYHALGRLSAVPLGLSLSIDQSGDEPMVRIKVTTDHGVAGRHTRHRLTLTGDMLHHVRNQHAREPFETRHGLSMDTLLAALASIPGVEVGPAPIVSAEPLRRNVASYLAKSVGLPEAITRVVGLGLAHVARVPQGVRVRVLADSERGGRWPMLVIETNEVAGPLHTVTVTRNWVTHTLDGRLLFEGPLEEESVVEAIALIPGVELTDDAATHTDATQEGHKPMPMTSDTRDFVSKAMTLITDPRVTLAHHVVAIAQDALMRIESVTRGATASMTAVASRPRFTITALVVEPSDQSTIATHFITIEDGELTHRIDSIIGKQLLYSGRLTVEDLVTALDRVPGMKVRTEGLAPPAGEDRPAATVSALVEAARVLRSAPDFSVPFPDPDPAHIVRGALERLLMVPDGFTLEVSEPGQIPRLTLSVQQYDQDHALVVHTIVVQRGQIAWATHHGLAPSIECVVHELTLASLLDLLEAVPGVELTAGRRALMVVEKRSRSQRIDKIMRRLADEHNDVEASFTSDLNAVLAGMADIDAFKVDFPQGDRAVFTLTPSRDGIRHRVVLMGDKVTWYARDADSKKKRLVVEGPGAPAQVVWLLDVVSARTFEL